VSLRDPLKFLFRLLAPLPLAWMAWQTLRAGGWADPIAQGLRALGLWALIFLLLCLAVTPVRELCNWQVIHPLRRLAGLAAFGYATAHLAVYLLLDQGGDWQAIGRDILRHRRIAVGLFTWAILLPLALTSHQRVKQWLGVKRWQALHSLTYPAAILAVLHYTWLVKADQLRPLISALILGILLGSRVLLRLRETRRPDPLSQNRRSS